MNVSSERLKGENVLRIGHCWSDLSRAWSVSGGALNQAKLFRFLILKDNKELTDRWVIIRILQLMRQFSFNLVSPGGSIGI